MSQDDDESVIPREVEFDIEDETPDWSTLSGSGIPKRGDKDFEPDSTAIQSQSLQSAREAMYGAISGIRGHHVKQLLVGVWIEDGSEYCCVIPRIKGNYFRDIGIAGPNNVVYLNELETVYLVERGSMVIYLANELFMTFLKEFKKDDEFDYDTLYPLDLEFLYSLAFGHGKYGIDEYQIYSYLKRHGYMVLPYRQFTTSQVDRYNAYQDKINSNQGIWSTITNWFGWFKTEEKFPIIDSMHYLQTHYFNFTDVFQSLRLIQSYETFDSLKSKDSKIDDDFKLTFNVWKPGNSTFSKKNPPLPDFQILVVNADKNGFPKLGDIQKLLNGINYEFSFEIKNSNGVKAEKKIRKKNTMATSKKEIRQAQREKRIQSQSIDQQTRNEYLKTRDSIFKNGASGRSIILGVVSNGIINFFNLIEGDFNLRGELSKNKLEGIYKGRNHGIIYNGDL
ncbi:tRNA-splicing endonuclease subunit sen54 N-term-domain-containing protein [Scheffersomyces amazonensis]|uniref:tRNA-splicing endonuclease subunit sen54 N-term-domain-containing protein n=1 Tax=Scheffersomyces amazonensis TaxID=1078765 RepID=UPI00315DF821